jgi:acetyl esterase/lipase
MRLAFSFHLAAFACIASQTCFAETDLDELAKAPPGQKFSYGTEALQFGELHMPEGKGPHPVVINVHGGCWLAEYNINHSRALANALTKDGIAVWNIEYRRVGNDGGGWPGTFLDVANGADHLRVLAKDKPLDLSRVVAMGHSAGGYFALWLAARPKIPPASEIYTKDPLKLVGVVALAPAPELDALHEKKICGHVIDRLMGGAPDAMSDRYRAAMPSALAPLGVRNLLIVGKLDKPFGWVGEAYAAKVKSVDPQMQLIEAPEAGHFEVIDPASTTWPLVVKSTRDLLGVK